MYTYAELCKLFGEERKAGNSKKAQLREWSRFFRWRNETTQKYIIEEIFDTPFERIDGRANNGGNNTSKFLCLDDMAMEYFVDNEETKGTLAQLLVNIGLLTDKYYEYRFNSEPIVSSGIPRYVVSNVLWNINSCACHAFRAALERLKRDEYIDMQIYTVLVLKDGNEKILDHDMSDVIFDIENEVLTQLGKNRSDLFTPKVYDEYKSMVCRMILERYRWDVRYYFKEYRVKTTDKVYKKKSEESYDILSRKFVKTIGYAMLKVNIPKDEQDENNNSYGYTQTDLIRHTMELLNLFFVYMNDVSWDKYWDDGELDIDDSMRDAVFWVQYCLTKYTEECYENNLKRKKEEEYIKASTLCKEQAIEELQDYDIHGFMEVIPEIDWKRVFEDDEYAKLCGRAYQIYDDIDTSLVYYKDRDVAKAYRDYRTRMVFDGVDESETITIDEFKNKYRPA